MNPQHINRRQHEAWKLASTQSTKYESSRGGRGWRCLYDQYSVLVTFFVIIHTHWYMLPLPSDLELRLCPPFLLLCQGLNTKWLRAALLFPDNVSLELCVAQMLLVVMLMTAAVKAGHSLLSWNRVYLFKSYVSHRTKGRCYSLLNSCGRRVVGNYRGSFSSDII